MSVIRLSIIENSKERFFESEKNEISMGRSVNNDIMLRNSLSSRKHCILSKKENEFIIKDLSSRNGTRVNGKLINEMTIRVGDIIQVGKATTITLASPEPSPGDQRRAAFPTGVAKKTKPVPAPSLSMSMLHKPSQEEVDHSKVRRILDERERFVRLYEVTKAINSQLDSEKLMELIMDTAIELIQAERGCIVVVGEDQKPQEFQVARNLNKEDVSDLEFQLSQSIIHHVLTTGEAVSTTNAQEDSRFVHSVSIRDQKLRAILCIPFIVKSKILGVVYLDNRFMKVKFEDGDLHLLEVFAEQAAIALENARLYEEIARKERIEFEIETASAIQNHLLPLNNPTLEGIELVGHTTPATEMGGDYYDFILSPETKMLYFCIGDVAGHGVASGLVMVMIRSILHALIPHNLSTKDILVEANKILYGSIPKNMFLSLNLLRWDSQRKKICYTSAGHEYLVHYHHRSKEVEMIMAGGMVLGPMKDITPLITEKEMDLEPGDTLLLYTDGVTEATGDDGSYFSLERLKEVVLRWGSLSPQELIDKIEETVRKHLGKSDQLDDVTLVVLKRKLR